jgi:hypothetical protein
MVAFQFPPTPQGYLQLVKITEMGTFFIICDLKAEVEGYLLLETVCTHLVGFWVRYDSQIELFYIVKNYLFSLLKVPGLEKEKNLRGNHCLKEGLDLDVMAHACNPGYLRSRDW